MEREKGFSLSPMVRSGQEGGSVPPESRRPESNSVRI